MRLLTLCMWLGSFLKARFSSRVTAFLVNMLGLETRAICLSNLRTGDCMVLKAERPSPPDSCIKVVVMSYLPDVDLPNYSVPFAFFLMKSTFSWLKHDSLIEILSCAFRGTYLWKASLGTCLAWERGLGK